MSEKEYCLEHSGCTERLSIAEKDREFLWKSTNRSHERIDGMKNWVIAGMASLVIEMIVFIIAFVVK